MSLSEDLRFEHVPAVPDRQSCAQRFTSHALPQDSNDTATAVYFNSFSHVYVVSTQDLVPLRTPERTCGLLLARLANFIGRAFFSINLSTLFLTFFQQAELEHTRSNLYQQATKGILL